MASADSLYWSIPAQFGLESVSVTVNQRASVHGAIAGDDPLGEGIQARMHTFCRSDGPLFRNCFTGAVDEVL